MTFGWSKASRTVDDIEAWRMVRTFRQNGGVEVDTALMYMDRAGASERMLRRVLEDTEGASLLRVATKATPLISQERPEMVSGQVMGQPDASAAPAMGGLSASNLAWSLERSLVHLGTEAVDVFYLHQPDPETPLIETLQACNELHKQNKFARLGLSNYMAEEVAETCRLCEVHGWIAPTLYQGNYSAFNRDVEEDLIPVLKQNGLDFYAYNPLMAGILSGKYSAKGTAKVDSDGSAQPGRFHNNPNYTQRYWTSETFEALLHLEAACDDAGIQVIDAALGWLMCHSQLGSNDGIVLGASSADQLAQNIESCGRWRTSEQGLPATVLAALDNGWELGKENCYSYHRGPSGSV